jgi:hypothetical protein
MSSDRRAERRTFDLFLFHEMRMAGTSPAMAMFVEAYSAALPCKIRYFGSTAMFGKNR